jgi:hypothetical protein
MKQIKYRVFKKISPVYLILFAAFIGCLLYYHRYVYDFSYGDLGLKVAAARQQMHGEPVYFYTESNGDQILNGVVSTPFLNMLHTPLTYLSSCQIKKTWFWVIFILLFLCMLFTARLTAPSPWWRPAVITAVFISYFLCSRYLFFNLQYGQVYLLFGLLIFLLLFLLNQKQYFLFGLAISIAIALRPLFLPPAILTLIYFNKKTFAGLLTGAALLLLLTIGTGTVHYWNDYSKAMKGYATDLPEHMGITTVDARRHPIVLQTSLDDCPPKTELNKIFKTPQGRQNGLLLPLQAYLIKGFNLVIINTTFYSLIAAALTLLFAFIVRMRFKQISNEKYLLAFFVIYTICEICAPAQRGAYNFIFWMFGTAVILAKGNIVEILLIVLGLALSHDHPYVKYGRDFGEAIMLLSCFMYIFRKSETPYYLRWLQQQKWGSLPAYVRNKLTKQTAV